jgi:hypothetical protein
MALSTGQNRRRGDFPTGIELLVAHLREQVP